MSTNELNNSGCIAVRSTAQVPPIENPTIPQCSLLADPELCRHERHDVSSEVVGGVARGPLTHSVSLSNEPPVSTKTNTGALPPCVAAKRSIVLTASPCRIQSAGVLNWPPIIITVGSVGGGLVEYHVGGR